MNDPEQPLPAKPADAAAHAGDHRYVPFVVVPVSRPVPAATTRS